MTNYYVPPVPAGTPVCPRCEISHVTVVGNPVPTCEEHRTGGECDVQGSHLCGPADSRGMSTIVGWMQR
jgi:hypothetical protein